MASSSSKPGAIHPVDYGWADSDDDEENRIMTEEELEAYYREVDASEGFDVQTMPCPSLCGEVRPIHNPKLYDKQLQHGAKEAIKDYNEKNGTNFEIVEIEKATLSGCIGLMFYITFKVKPSNTPTDHPTTTFQAKVLYSVDGFSLELCRIKASS